MPLEATALTPAIHRKVSSPAATLSRMPVGHQSQLNCRALAHKLSSSPINSSLFLKPVQFIVDLPFFVLAQTYVHTLADCKAVVVKQSLREHRYVRPAVL